MSPSPPNDTGRGKNDESSTPTEGVDQMTSLVQRHHSNSSASISQLPLEILGEILKLAAFKDQKLTDSQMLLRICLVSSVWRNVAYSTADLWRRVRIVLDSKGQWIEAMTWTSRARKLVKDVYVLLEDGDQCECGTDFEDSGFPKCVLVSNPDLVKMLVDGPSLETLSLEVTTSQCFINIQKVLEESMSRSNPPSCRSLKSLRLSFQREGSHGGAWFDGENDRPFIPDIYPHLESLKVFLPFGCNIEFEEILEAPVNVHPLILSRLTSLSIRCNWGGPQIPLLLQGCASLEQLSIAYPLQPLTYGQHPIAQRILAQGLVLPRLRRLKFEKVEVATAGQILSFAKFPSLIELEVGIFDRRKRYERPTVGEDEPSPLRPVWELLDSLGILSQIPPHPLRSLAITNTEIFDHRWRSPRIDSQEIIDVLAGCPSLTHLSFADIPLRMLKRHSVRTYGRPLSPESILPNLEQLSVEMTWSTDFPLGPFLRLLMKARRMAVSAQTSDSTGSEVLEGGRRDSFRKIALRGFGSRPILESASRSSPHLESLQRRYGVLVELY